MCDILEYFVNCIREQNCFTSYHKLVTFSVHLRFDHTLVRVPTQY